MDYSPEQRAIIRRIGAISRQIDAATKEVRGRHLDLGRALLVAIRQSSKIGRLQTRYGDAFREFLDTL
jgi:hypothetical protein